MAIAVAEKTQLQSEKRSIAEHQKALEKEIDFLRSQTKGAANPAELISLQAENQQLHQKLDNQSTTISQQRSECLALEAQLVVLNQDKNDIQVSIFTIFKHYF